MNVKGTSETSAYLLRNNDSSQEHYRALFLGSLVMTIKVDDRYVLLLSVGHLTDFNQVFFLLFSLEFIQSCNHVLGLIACQIKLELIF